jgi:nitrite reductase/ring-hydroxylating ferredoxin subunit
VAPIAVGQAITVKWRGKPVFIRHRTEAEIKEAEGCADVAAARPADRQCACQAKKVRKWLIMIGVCTHLGCVPLGNKPGDPKGDYGGWFCPCHGSHYDTAGRIRKGPAPKNLWFRRTCSFRHASPHRSSQVVRPDHRWNSSMAFTRPAGLQSSAGSTSACRSSRMMRRSYRHLSDAAEFQLLSGISARSPWSCW